MLNENFETIGTENQPKIDANLQWQAACTGMTPKIENIPELFGIIPNQIFRNWKSLISLLNYLFK